MIGQVKTMPASSTQHTAPPAPAQKPASATMTINSQRFVLDPFRGELVPVVQPASLVVTVDDQEKKKTNFEPLIVAAAIGAIALGAIYWMTR